MDQKNTNTLLSGGLAFGAAAQVADDLARITMHHAMGDWTMPEDVAQSWMRTLTWVYTGIATVAVGAIARVMTRVRQPGSYSNTEEVKQ